MVVCARVRIVHLACIDVTFRNPSWFALNIFMCWMLSLMPSFANVLEALIFVLSFWIWSCMLDETTTQAHLHCCHPFLLHLILITLLLPFLHRFSPTSRTEYIQKYTSIEIIWNYLSNKWSFIINRARRKKLCSFYFSAACCSEKFRTHALRCFGYNRL
jgi:hypothetical protein